MQPVPCYVTNYVVTATRCHASVCHRRYPLMNPVRRRLYVFSAYSPPRLHRRGLHSASPSGRLRTPITAITSPDPPQLQCIHAPRYSFRAASVCVPPSQPNEDRTALDRRHRQLLCHVILPPLGSRERKNMRNRCAAHARSRTNLMTIQMSMPLFIPNIHSDQFNP